MNTPATALLLVNQRAYKMPVHPTVVVCVDGCDPDYLAQAVAAGRAWHHAATIFWTAPVARP